MLCGLLVDISHTYHDAFHSYHHSMFWTGKWSCWAAGMLGILPFGVWSSTWPTWLWLSIACSGASQVVGDNLHQVGLVVVITQVAPCLAVAVGKGVSPYSDQGLRLLACALKQSCGLVLGVT